MRTLFILSFLSVLYSTAAFGQTANAAYDSVLAKKLGADEHGMKRYVLAFLKQGLNTDTSNRKQLIQAHLKNIGRLAKEGKLVVSGPFLDKGTIAGIYVFNVTTIDEARSLTASDPAVKAGIFDMELHPWYSSAALMETVPIHNTLQKKSITD